MKNRTTAEISIALTMNRLVMRGAGAGSGDQAIQGVSLSRLISGLADQTLDLGARRAAVGACGAHDVLFDPRAAHVVGSEFQGHLTELLSLSDKADLIRRNLVTEDAHDS